MIFELDKPLRETLRHRVFAVELNREGAKPPGSAKYFKNVELDKPPRETLRHRVFAVKPKREGASAVKPKREAAFTVKLNREGAKPRGSAKDFKNFDVHKRSSRTFAPSRLCGEA